MASTHGLIPRKTAESPPVMFLGTLTPLSDFNQSPLVGTSDPGDSVRVVFDSKSITTSGDFPSVSLFWEWEDDGFLPATISITRVTVLAKHSAVGGAQVNGFYGDDAVFDPETDGYYCPRFMWTHSLEVAGGQHPVPYLDPPFTAHVDDPAHQQDFSFMTSRTADLTVNPGTGLPWTRADLFAKPTMQEGYWWIQALGGSGAYVLDQLTLEVEYLGVQDGGTLLPGNGVGGGGDRITFMHGASA